MPGPSASEPLRSTQTDSLPLSPTVRKVLRVAAVAGLTAIALHIAHGQLGLGGRALNSFFYDWVYDAIVLGGAVSCLARAWLIREERLPWLLLGIGLASNATGEIYYSLAFGDSGNPPIPSLADLFYLMYYPAAFAALLLLVRGRIHVFRTGTWIDGAIAAVTSAAVIAAITFEPILHSATGDTASVLTTLAYPVGDMTLLGIAVGMLALTGWRPGRAWLLLALGLSLSAIADTGYAYANANNTYAVGGILDSMWLGSALLTGAAPWQPRSSPAPTSTEQGSVRLLLLPGLFALVALAVLLYGGFHHVGALALALAGAAILLVLARAGLIFAENVRLLRRSQHEATTDALTGLGNRRAMQAALERLLADGERSRRTVFVMFDLDGFKAYNDRFGHLAGDTLLAHLGDRLRAAVGAAGAAYRPGGDEFGVILGGIDATDVLIAAAEAALSADGEGFTVRASYGSVAIPSDAATPSDVLRLADDRMYARKSGRRSSAGQQTHDALLGLLRERQPELHDHLREVGRLALNVGRDLGMDTEQLDELRRAAELHDIGKAAIPDAILEKPGPLTRQEWDFMRRHTLIGERILLAAPALGPVAKLVRSSHERWDGRGYPDGLTGEEIPLGARIILVCDAFDAMRTERPYGSTMPASEALTELCRGAGRQFDPDVVDAFAASLRSGAADDARAPAPPSRR